MTHAIVGTSLTPRSSQALGRKQPGLCETGLGVSALGEHGHAVEGKSIANMDGFSCYFVNVLRYLIGIPQI